jgi:hypothetical protein
VHAVLEQYRRDLVLNPAIAGGLVLLAAVLASRGPRTRERATGKETDATPWPGVANKGPANISSASCVEEDRREGQHLDIDRGLVVIGRSKALAACAFSSQTAQLQRSNPNQVYT